MTGIPTPWPTLRPDRRSYRAFALALVYLLVVSGVMGWDLTLGWRWLFLPLVPLWIVLLILVLLRVWMDGWRVGYLLALRRFLEAMDEETAAASARDGEA